MTPYQLALISALFVYTATAAPAPVIPAFSGWQADWVTTLPDGNITKYTEMSYFAALTTDTTVAMSDGSPDPFNNFTLPNPSINKLMSIGGWGGTGNWSHLVKTDASRQTLAKDVAALMKNASGGLVFNGVDIDWEFPNGKPDNQSDLRWDRGNSCNEVDPADSANLLSFIKVLRTTLKTAIGKDPVLTAAAPMNGWSDENGNKLQDVSAYVADDTLDYITVMTYDVAHNYRLETGMNAPLDDKCAPWDQQWSINKAMAYWSKAAGGPGKIQIGLPAYSKIFKTKQAELTPGVNGCLAYQAKEMPKLGPGDTANGGNVKAGDIDTQGLDKCSIWRDWGATYTYAQLFNTTDPDSQPIKYLTDDGKGETPDPSSGYTYYWDDCTSSPFLYNKEKQLFITYDNPKSIQIKSNAIYKAGFKGIKLYHVAGDHKGQLMEAVHAGWTDSPANAS